MTQKADILKQLRLGEYVVAEFVAKYSDAQLNWQPEGGKSWSIVQCVDHIARSTDSYLAAMMPEIERAGPSTGGEYAPGFFARSFIRNLAPPPKLKFPAPKKILPESNISGVEAMERFTKAHEGMRKALRALETRDANAIKFRNPLAPLIRIKASSGLLIATAHEKRHLWQATQVSEKIPQRL